jgi:cytochrome c556
VRALLALVLLTGCPKKPTMPTTPVDDGDITELGLMMKNDVNPAFSKLTVLVFHGDEMPEEPAAIQRELTTAASVLRTSIARLREWRDPPTKTTEARDVFFTYAVAVDQSTARLVDAITRFDSNEAATQMEQIAKTCNSCHHFFRLKIEDSVMPPR